MSMYSTTATPDCASPARRLYLLPLLSGILLLFGIATTSAQLKLEKREVIHNLSVPIQMLWGYDNYLWIAEQEGRILRVSPETGSSVEIGRITDIFIPRQMGLLGMAFDPDFSDSSYVYIYYAYQRVYDNDTWQHLGKVVKYWYDSAAEKLIDPRIIADSLSTVDWTMGGGLLALPDRTLLIGIGDGVNFANEVQGHETVRGKILRIGLDGSVPADNPWIEDPYPLNTIWAKGVQNPMAFARNPATGTVYATDHGTSSLDEVNILERNGNYGWPFVIGYCDNHPNPGELGFCADSNVLNPIYEWYREGDVRASPSDIVYVDTSNISHWSHSLLIPTILDGLHRLQLSPRGDSIIRDDHYLSPRDDSASVGILRAACLSPDGRLFVATANGLSADSLRGHDQIFEVLDAEEGVDTVEHTPMVVREVVKGLKVPWEIVWGYYNYIWMTERDGRVSRVNPETGEMRQICMIPDVVGVENSGLLGMALHPAFCDSSYVYLVYTYQKPGGGSTSLWERVVRYHYDAINDTLVDPMVLLDSIDATPSHAGSRIVIDKNRKLYVSLSDADQEHNTQVLESRIGKVVRINLDGSVPEDNPFADHPWPANLVWTMGHRNPQGLVFGRDGNLYNSEHGPWTDDEVNHVLPGRNYGWSEVSGYCDTPYEKRYCEDVGVTEPMIAWTPTIAPSGLEYYPHSQFKEWENSLLLSILKGSRILALRLNESGDSVNGVLTYFPFVYGRIRDICVAPDGRIFFVTSNEDGVGVPKEGGDRLYEIRSLNGHPELPAPGSLCDKIQQGGNSVDEQSLTSFGRDVVPHPVRDMARIALGRTFSKGTAVLFDESGGVVMEHDFSGGAFYLFVRGSLPAGVYYLYLKDQRGDSYHRFVVR